MSSPYHTDAHRRRPKVCIVAPLCIKGDAISAAVLADYQALQGSGEFDPVVLSQKCEYDIAHANVRGLSQILYHPLFVDADVRLFHFGSDWDGFNACMLGKGRVKRIFRFHNITPPEFFDPPLRQSIDTAYRLVAAMATADEIWPISPFNARTLQGLGYQVDMAKVLPMPVLPLTDRLDIRSKPSPITITFVGRIVPSKGIHCLIDAFQLLKARGYADVELVVIGGQGRRDFTESVRKRLEDSAIDKARFVGRVSHEELALAYEQASIVAIPSLHEGLCVPVIEALYAGAVPVVSESTALPDTLNGLGRLARAGDAKDFADRLEEVVCDLQAIRRGEKDVRIRVERGAMLPDEYHAAVSDHVKAYDPKVLGAALVERIRALTGNTWPDARV